MILSNWSVTLPEFLTNLETHARGLLSLMTSSNWPSIILESLTASDTHATIHLFLTFNSSFYSKVYSPLGSSNHTFITVFCPIAPVQPQDQLRKPCVWHFGLAHLEGLRWFPMEWLPLWSRGYLCVCPVHLRGCMQAFHALSLLLLLKYPGSITLILVLSKIVRQVTKGIWPFQLLTTIHFTFLPGMCQMYPSIYLNFFLDRKCQNLANGNSSFFMRILASWQ